MNSFLEGEEQQNFTYVNGSVSANRTAQNVKINLRVNGNYERSEQQLTTETYVNTTKTYSASQLVAWSLSPHWSLGLHSAQSSSTYLNYDFALRAGQALGLIASKKELSAYVVEALKSELDAFRSRLKAGGGQG